MTLGQNFNKQIQSESGMTLIEVMVVVTLLSVLSVTFAQFFANIARQQKIAEVKGNVYGVSMRVQNTVLNPQSVYQSGLNPDEVPSED